MQWNGRSATFNNKKSPKQIGALAYLAGQSCVSD
jgi:hypothetical protein